MVIDERKVNLAEARSCIRHPRGEPMVIVSKALLSLCKENRSAMEIAGLFCLASAGKSPLIAPATFTEIAQHCLLFTSRTAIQDGLDVMVAESLLNKSTYTDEHAVAMLTGKIGQRIDGGKVCEWCKGTTYTLEAHHYPIRRAKGGEHVVNICANCHREYHYLTSNSFYSPTAKLLSAIRIGNDFA